MELKPENSPLQRTESVCAQNGGRENNGAAHSRISTERGSQQQNDSGLQQETVHPYRHCSLCPRACGADRAGGVYGFCGCGAVPKVARAALHMWEEPCISGVRGSGAVFFSGCTLRCCFCQNQKISAGRFGKEVSENHLAEIFLSLQEKGAHNINLVTATQYLPSVTAALEQVRGKLRIPVVYNCGGYETEESIRALAPYVSIWLPDLKYKSSELSARYSGAADYFAVASKAVLLMTELAGPPVFEQWEGGANAGNAAETKEKLQTSCRLMKRGVIVRHMVMPGQRKDSEALLDWMAEALPKDGFLLSMLSQYTPYHKSKAYPELNRKITTYEYQKVVDHAIALGLTNGYMQEKTSAKEEYTPPFNLEGV